MRQAAMFGDVEKFASTVAHYAQISDKYAVTGGYHRNAVSDGAEG